jgi:hypothetical protein
MNPSEPNNNDQQTPPTPGQPVVMPPAPQVQAPGPVLPPNPNFAPAPVMGLPPQPASSKRRMLVIVVAILIVIGVVVAAVVLRGHKSDKNGGAAGSSSSSGSSAEPEIAYQTYTNDQFHISFKYPASWGSVTISQTTGPQSGGSGVSSYNATFSNKDGGSDILGHPNPYLFRINSYKWSVDLDASNPPSLAYRTVGVGTDNTEVDVSPGLNYCVRLDFDSETCSLFSRLGDWTTINNNVLAKQSGGGVGLFVPLAANTGDNYTMASFYSTSMSDYKAFQKIAETFSGQLKN